MVQNLPVDTSNPLVKDYLTLVRHGTTSVAVFTVAEPPVFVGCRC